MKSWNPFSISFLSHCLNNTYTSAGFRNCECGLERYIFSAGVGQWQTTHVTRHRENGTQDPMIGLYSICTVFWSQRWNYHSCEEATACKDMSQGRLRGCSKFLQESLQFVEAMHCSRPNPGIIALMAFGKSMLILGGAFVWDNKYLPTQQVLTYII